MHSTFNLFMLYLASRSPRRQQLLKQIGVEFELVDINVNEDWDGIEQVQRHVERLSLEKARAGKAKIKLQNNFAVLGADTAVVLDDRILGKALNEEEAKHLLQTLSGRMHHVYTAVTLITNKGEKTKTSISRVVFRPITANEIESYCRTGEPIGKAGAYAIQGHAAAFIERLDGSYSGVMSLPLYETADLLMRSQNFVTGSNTG